MEHPAQELLHWERKLVKHSVINLWIPMITSDFQQIHDIQTS